MKRIVKRIVKRIAPVLPLCLILAFIPAIVFAQDSNQGIASQDVQGMPVVEPPPPGF
jgi:hypothetical protein